MVKLVFCARRQAGLSLEQFQDYWKNSHGPMFQRHARELGAVKYVQNHTLAHPVNQALRQGRGTQAPYDGVGEIWWESLEAFTKVMQNPSMQALRQSFVDDERRFIDMGQSSVFFVEELPFPLA